jgi:hypothetical protein
MSDTERGALKGAAADVGLDLTYSIGMTADRDLASEDAATRGRHRHGRRNYSCWPRKLLPVEDKQALTDRAVEGVREAIKAAKDCGVLGL